MVKRGRRYRQELQEPPWQQQQAQQLAAGCSSSSQVPDVGSPSLPRPRSSISQLVAQGAASPGGLLSATHAGSGLGLQLAAFIDSRSAMEARLCWAQLEQQLQLPCGLLDNGDASTIKVRPGLRD
jgi:hypothetical protein